MSFAHTVWQGVKMALMLVLGILVLALFASAALFVAGFAMVFLGVSFYNGLIIGASGVAALVVLCIPAGCLMYLYQMFRHSKMVNAALPQMHSHGDMY